MNVPSSTPAATPSASAAPGVVAWYAEGFSDRIGDRLLLFDSTGPALELLRLTPQLASVPGFEAALRARVDELRDFRHPVFARVRCVTTLDDPRPQLAIVSELVEGERLSKVLHAAASAGVRPDPGAAVWLLRQLLPAMADLHQRGHGIAHGLLGADRIVVRPDGGFAITEYVLADGLEHLGLTAADLWRHFGIAAHDSASGPRIDASSDVTQMGLLALSVLLGRPLGPDEYPGRLGPLIEEACNSRTWALAPVLRPWLTRALAVGAPAFASAHDAQTALDALLPGVSGTWSARLLPPGPPPVLSAAPASPGVAAGRPLAPAPPRPAPAPPPFPVPPASPMPGMGTPSALHKQVRSAPAPPVSAPRPRQQPAAARLADTDRRAPGSMLGLREALRTGPGAVAAMAEDPAAALAAQVRVNRRLRRLSAGLGAVAVLEAMCLVLLLRPAPTRQEPGVERAALPMAAEPTAGVLDAGAESERGSRGRAVGVQTARGVSARSPRVAQSGERAQLVVARPRSAPSPDTSAGQSTRADGAQAGWFAVSSPAAVRVYADGRLLGSSISSPFQLPAGDHAVRLVTAAGAQSTHDVHVPAGRTVTVILHRPPIVAAIGVTDER